MKAIMNILVSAILALNLEDNLLTEEEKACLEEYLSISNNGGIEE